MKTLLVIVGLTIVAGSLLADYKWKQWMAARKREMDRERNFRD